MLHTGNPVGPVQTQFGSDSVPQAVLLLRFHPAASTSISFRSEETAQQYRAAAERLPQLLQHNVWALKWLQSSMEHLESSSSSSSADRRAVSAVPDAPKPTTLSVKEAPLTAAAAADELTFTMCEAARLDRVTEVRSFLVERVCSSTPAQRAASSPQEVEVVALGTVVPPRSAAARVTGCLAQSGVPRDHAQLLTRLHVKKDDSLLALPCSKGPDQLQTASDLLHSCCPMSVAESSDAEHGLSNVKDDVAVKYTSERQTFSITSQPYFLASRSSLSSLLSRESAAVVEKSSINIGGYLCKVC